MNEERAERGESRGFHRGPRGLNISTWIGSVFIVSRPELRRFFPCSVLFLIRICAIFSNHSSPPKQRIRSDSSLSQALLNGEFVLEFGSGATEVVAGRQGQSPARRRGPRSLPVAVVVPSSR